MLELYAKSLHIIFLVCWFAGLFYIVRLFIYHVEANERPELEKKILQDQFKVMQRRLWLGITWPSAILTGIFGFILLQQFLPISAHPWLMAKLFLVFLLYLYHIYCGRIFSKLQKNIIPHSSTQLRILNEVATLFLFSIVFLVVIKDEMTTMKFLLYIAAFATVLMSGIKIYKNLRKDQ